MRGTARMLFAAASLMFAPGVCAALTGTATSADHVKGTYVAPGETGTWRSERVP